MAPVTRTRVMIVDDHEVMREGLREVLRRGPVASRWWARPGDGEAAVRLAHNLKPDVVVMDVMMPLKNGIDACREISEALPGTSVLILTAATEEDAVVEAAAAGAVGYVQKFSGKKELLRTRPRRCGWRVPHTCKRDGARVCRNPCIGPSQRRHRRPADLHRVNVRSSRCSRRGCPTRKIAEVRGNQPVTVRNAIYGIQDKLGVETKQELVVWAVRNGLLDDSARPGTPTPAGSEAPSC